MHYKPTNDDNDVMPTPCCRAASRMRRATLHSESDNANMLLRQLTAALGTPMLLHMPNMILPYNMVTSTW